jgi:hypothetical protein
MSKVLPVFGVDSMERENMIDEGCAVLKLKAEEKLFILTNPVDSV